MRKIVFDIETSNIFQDVGSNNPADLNLAVVAVHDSETDGYASFVQDELPDLWHIIERADMLIGYNSDHFDVPLLDKYYPGDLTKIKSVDLMKEIYNSLGRRLRLDNVAKTTLGEGKTGNGLEALSWWKKGEVEKVRQYCVDDVRITKQLYEHALRESVVQYMDGPEKRTIKLDTSGWEDKNDHAMTHTLGF